MEPCVCGDVTTPPFRGGAIGPPRGGSLLDLLVANDLIQRLAVRGAGPVGGVAQGHHLDDLGGVRYAQDLPDLVLVKRPDPAGAQALGHGRQGDVLEGDGHVDGIARDVAAHHPLGHQAHAGDHHGGGADELLVAAGGHHLRAGVRVGDDHELPRLAVGPRRRQPGRLQHPSELVRLHRLVLVRPHAVPLGNRFLYVHGSGSSRLWSAPNVNLFMSREQREQKRRFGEEASLPANPLPGTSSSFAAASPQFCCLCSRRSRLLLLLLLLLHNSVVFVRVVRGYFCCFFFSTIPSSSFASFAAYFFIFSACSAASSMAPT